MRGGGRLVLTGIFRLFRQVIGSFFLCAYVVCAQDASNITKPTQSDMLVGTRVPRGLDWSAPTPKERWRVWWRGIADLIILEEGKTAKVVDYKTGKSQYADVKQLEILALAMFKHFPQVERVKGALFFVVSKNFIKDSYSADNQDKLWSKWIGEYNRMKFSYENDIWNPRPSGLCKKHCLVLECPHNGRN